MFDLSAFPTLSALLTSNPDRAHAFLRPIELALIAESDARTRQALQWATALGMNVENILSQIPEIPATILQPRGDLNLLTLVPFHLGNVQVAKAAGLKHGEYGYTDDSLVPVNPRYEDLLKGWAWILAHDGTPNLNRKPSDCLAECVGGRYAGVDKVGIAIHLIHGKRGHAMDLPGSVHADDRGGCAYVDPFDDPVLDASGSVVADPQFGSVVFVRE